MLVGELCLIIRRIFYEVFVQDDHPIVIHYDAAASKQNVKFPVKIKQPNISNMSIEWLKSPIITHFLGN